MASTLREELASLKIERSDFIRPARKSDGVTEYRRRVFQGETLQGLGSWLPDSLQCAVRVHMQHEHNAPELPEKPVADQRRYELSPEHLKPADQIRSPRC